MAIAWQDHAQTYLWLTDSCPHVCVQWRPQAGSRHVEERPHRTRWKVLLEPRKRPPSIQAPSTTRAPPPSSPQAPRLSAVHPLTLRGDISYGPFCRPWLLFKLGTACRRRISWTTSSRWQWTSTSAKADVSTRSAPPCGMSSRIGHPAPGRAAVRQKGPREECHINLES